MEVYEYNWGRKRTCRAIKHIDQKQGLNYMQVEMYKARIAGLAKRGNIK